MKVRTLAAALALLAAPVAHAQIIGGAPPNVDITRIHPNLGSTADPEVRVERVRRSTTGDTGLINFETRFRNRDGRVLELERLGTYYFGGAGMSSGQFDAWDNADLLRWDNGAFDITGTRIDEDSDMGTSSARGLDILANGDYAVAGLAVEGGTPRLYFAKHDDDDGQLLAERVLLPSWHAYAEAVAVVPASGGNPERIVAAGRAQHSGGARSIVIGMVNNDDDLSPVTSFSGDGVRVQGVPGCGDELVTDVIVTGIGAAERYTVAGWGTCSGLKRGFLARFKPNGNLDTSFAGNGIQMIDAPWDLPVRTKALRARTEFVDGGDFAVRAQRIYAVHELNECYAEASGNCYILVTKHTASGALDTDFGSGGMKLLGFPSSSSSVPVGLEFSSGNKVVIGATRFDGDGDAWAGVVRINADGDVDDTFHGDGYRVAKLDGDEIALRDIDVDAAGRIVVAGATVEPGEQRNVGVIRFSPSGAYQFGTLNRQPAGDYPLVYDLAVDNAGKYVVAGYEGPRTQLSRVRPDGRKDWRGVLDNNETQLVYWPDEREVPTPFPGRVRLALKFQENGFNVVSDTDVDEDYEVKRFPGAPVPNTRAWVTTQHHLVRNNHRASDSQRYALDLNMRRWTGETWTSLKAGGSWNKNEDRVIWGQPVYAADAGRIAHCWRNAPDNSKPGDKTVFESTPMPGGGNMFYIDHADGLRALYAHFQQGGISADVCPVTCTDYITDVTDPDYYWKAPGQTRCSGWIDPALDFTVDEGDELGRVGNSGRSTGPHLHFDLRVSDVGVPMYFTNVFTDQQLNPHNQPGTVPLSGTATAAPALDGVGALLYPPLYIPISRRR